MIQKPPKFTTGTVDLDDEDAQPASHEAEAAMAAPAHEPGLADDYPSDADDELDVDFNAEAARKRRAMLIFYAGTAAGIALIGFIGYHQFAPLFQHQAAPAPVAVKAPNTAQPSPLQTANKLPVPPANSGSTLPPPAGMTAGTAPIPAPPAAFGIGNSPPSLPSQMPAQMPGQLAQDTGQHLPLPNGLPGPGTMPVTMPPAIGGPMPGTANPNPALAKPPFLPTGMPAGMATGSMPGAPVLGAPAAGASVPGNPLSGMPMPMPGAPVTMAAGGDKLPVPAAGTPVPSLPAGTAIPSPSSAPASVPPAPPSQTGPAAGMPTAGMPAIKPPMMGNMAMPGAGSTPSLPMPTGAFAPASRIDDLSAKFASLQASQKTTATQLQQIQTSLDSVQKQLAQAAPTPARNALVVTKTVPHRVHHDSAAIQTEASSRGSNHTVSRWVLRSATPNSALLGRSSTGELQHVAVGDMVNGLGRITYIGEKNGRWVVQGAEGRVEE